MNGDGKIDNPYKIKTEADLIAIRDLVNGGININSSAVTNGISFATVKTGSNVGGVIGYILGKTATATNYFSYNKAPIGSNGTPSGTKIDVKQVYKLENTDGNVTLPDEVNENYGFMYDNVRHCKATMKVLFTVNLGQCEGYEIEVKYGETVIEPNNDGQCLLMPQNDVIVEAAHKPITYASLTAEHLKRLTLRPTRLRAVL